MKFVSVDPGDSTGFAVWEDADLVYAGTLDAWDFVDHVAAGMHLYDAVVDGPPQLRHVGSPNLNPEPAEALEGWERLVVEDWRLYPWKLENHGMDWDACLTARYIGALELVCRLTGRPITLQPAAIKSDALRAGAEHLFHRPLHDARHQNDAIQHGWYFLARSGALQATESSA